MSLFIALFPHDLTFFYNSTATPIPSVFVPQDNIEAVDRHPQGCEPLLHNRRYRRHLGQRRV